MTLYDLRGITIYIWKVMTMIHEITQLFTADLITQMLFAMFSETVPVFNSSPPGQNGRHFTDDIFICIFVNEKLCILIKIPLKFVTKGPIDNNPTLV